MDTDCEQSLFAAGWIKEGLLPYWSHLVFAHIACVLIAHLKPEKYSLLAPGQVNILLLDIQFQSMIL